MAVDNVGMDVLRGVSPKNHQASDKSDQKMRRKQNDARSKPQQDEYQKRKCEWGNQRTHNLAQCHNCSKRDSHTGNSTKINQLSHSNGYLNEVSDIM